MRKTTTLNFMFIETIVIVFDVPARPSKNVVNLFGNFDHFRLPRKGVNCPNKERSFNLFFLLIFKSIKHNVSFPPGQRSEGRTHRWQRSAQQKMRTKARLHTAGTDSDGVVFCTYVSFALMRTQAVDVLFPQIIRCGAGYSCRKNNRL